MGGVGMFGNGIGDGYEKYDVLELVGIGVGLEVVGADRSLMYYASFDDDDP
jgi:hypothetical protein